MINKTSSPFIPGIYKRLLINCRIAFIPLALLFFISSTCFAQSFFGTGIQNTPAQQNPAPSSSGSSPNQVMSAEDYKNLVNNLGKQNQDNLTQSSQAQLNKQAPVIQPIETNPTTSAPAVEPAVQNNSSATPQTSTVTAPPVAPIQQPPVVAQPVTPPPVVTQAVAQPPVVAQPVTQPPVVAQPVTQPPVATSVTSPTPSNSSGSVMPTTPAAASTPSTNASHSQAYTGFGNFGNTNNTGSTTNTNSSNGKSEGWNIHY